MRILITSGGTREYIDPVRFITNASSGRMGIALADAARKAGHKVTLITAPSSQNVPDGVRIIRVETAAQMFIAVKKHFDKCDCLIMAAAVADYTPCRKSKVKIKKASSDLTIRLKPTVDILRWAGKHKKVKSKKEKGKKRIVVGFALEDKNLRKNAEKKLQEKNID
ncbi:MAG: phosphopantothenoylcysteine decarboxylase, partial [Sedimentisphaerales bacterium]|nr:phosphopantothenoylcysteine decarboxylase [Sedimentisphaerales bacterium]